jgi:mono/diheme cytochrome c family protein
MQAAATPNADPNLTTVNVEPSGSDWTAAIWQTNGTGTAVSPSGGQTCALVFNGTSIGNGLNNTRIRSPESAVAATFPGDCLTLNTNTELRAKFTNSTTLAFPGVGANPGLILNGGMLNDGSDGLAVITGSVQVTGQSYNSAQAQSGGGGGLAANPRAFTISANLSGSGNLVIMNCSTNLPQVISGTSNTFTGQWIVQCGWLQGASANSLGTNNITVDPLYTGYLSTMPGATSPNGPALFEVNYDLNSSGALTLANGGLMNLHQNCTFAAVTIQGVSLAAGTYSYAQLAANYPNNFLPGGSGSITVNPPIVATPGPVSSPTGLTAVAGNAQVYLSWNANQGATNYNVKRSTSSGGIYTNVASTTGTSYTNTGLANGVTYYYEVSANSAPGYTLTAVATDGSGLTSTSAPVHITVNPGSGQPYGLASNQAVNAFLNMPTTIPAVLPGALPTVLSGTGAYVDTPNRTPAGGLIPYVPNTPLWSDGAVKSRYMAVPSHGGPITPDEQIAFLPTNTWTFPSGTVFVKNFDLVVNETNSSVPLRRLETRLLVRDINGAVYGVTYKWRPDNSEADLLTTSLNEDILITNATGVRTQTWYYPSPADCLTCHTPVANYVLGVNTRQLNGNLLYSSTGVTDNQLRTLNHLGIFYPAINEANISNYSRLSALTNLAASLEERSRSYFDANCAQCHQPGGTGGTFDARYDTPLANQYITNYPAQYSLGADNACIIKSKDIWRSMIYQRMNTTNPAIKMPKLARNIIDTNAVQVVADWINSLPGTPALPPPTITPSGGNFNQTVTVTMQGSDPNAKIYYTTDGTLPTSNSSLYSTPLVLTSNMLLTANEFETNYVNSVAASASFVIQPLTFSRMMSFSNHVFQMQLFGTTGSNYVLQASTNFTNWTPISTNTGLTNPIYLVDPAASNFPRRFYRVLQQ